MATETLKLYCQQLVPLTPDELTLIDTYFVSKQIGRNDFLLQEGHVCDFIAFVNQGIIRHFHTKEGVEKTCDISFQNSFVTDFTSYAPRSEYLFVTGLTGYGGSID